jgi:O-antigen/teichoic acid export membrane protein
MDAQLSDTKPADAPPGATTLKDRVIGGIAWNILTQLVMQGSRIVVGIVLARLLTPHQFGVAGMAFVFSNLLTTFADPSLGAALVQRPEITEEDRSTVFWTTLAVGLLCTALGVGVSGLIADFFHQPEVGPLFAVLSIGFTLFALSATQTALLTRELAYRRLQIRDMVSIVFGAIVGIVFAAAGFGAWAIVSQNVAFFAASAVLIWTLSSWRPRLVFSTRSVRELGSFGIKLLGSRFLSYANLNADNLLVGRFLGGQALGNYSLAYNVMFTPMVRLGLPFQQVVFPAYAKLQSDPERLGAAWVRSKRLAAAVLAPAFLGIFVTAADLVPVVFGEKWHAVVPVLQLLCLAGLAHTFVTLNWSVLQACGRAGVLLRLNLLYTVVTVAAFALGLHWGIVGVAACYAVARWLLVLPDTWITVRPLALNVLESLRGSGVAIPVAAVSAAAAYGIRALLVGQGVGSVGRLVLVLAAGGALYVGLLLVAAPDLVAEIKGLRASLARSRAAPDLAEEVL